MFQSNKVNLVISIVLAIALWAYVFFEINPVKDKTISDIPVKLTGINELESRDLTVIETEEYMVDVTIKGPRSEIAQITKDDIEATADISTFTEGENDVKVKVTVPDNVTKDDVKPTTISVVIDEYVTESKAVKISYDGQFEENTEPGFVTLNPESMKVSGAKSIIKTISHIKAIVKSSDVKDTEQSLKIKPTPVDEKGNTVSGVSLSQKTVDVTCTLCYTKTVPLKVPIKGKVDSDYKVTGRTIPDSVKIKGVKSQLDKITKVEAESINISNIKKTTEIPIEINLPDRVELSEESENLVAVIEISGITVKDFTYSTSDITMENVKSGYTAKLDDATIKVSVYGKSKNIIDVSKSDIVLYIDMKSADYTTGIYMATIEYKSSKTFDNVTFMPETIQVTLSEKL